MPRNARNARDLGGMAPALLVSIVKSVRMSDRLVIAGAYGVVSRRLAALLIILQPLHGERLLDVGRGIGTHAFPMALCVGPTGRIVVLDVQHEMLGEIARRAADTGVTNIRSVQADATNLPYVDAVFDGAFLIGVLGEVPDQDTALRELRRVLKPAGRLVIGEIAFDPDFSSLSAVSARMARAGFMFDRKVGIPVAYLARFQRV